MPMVRSANMPLSIAAGHGNRKGLDLNPTASWLVLPSTRPGGVSGHGFTGCDATGDHAASADYCTVADGNAGQENGAAADPDVAANLDGTAEFKAGAARFDVARMIGGVNLDRRPYLRAIANRHFDDVENDAVEVEEYAVANGY
jgi:hypothetical protein